MHSPTIIRLRTTTKTFALTHTSLYSTLLQISWKHYESCVRLPNDKGAGNKFLAPFCLLKVVWLLRFVSREAVNHLIDHRAETHWIADEVVSIGDLARCDGYGAVAENAAYNGLFRLHAFTLTQQQFVTTTTDDTSLEDQSAVGDNVTLASMDLNSTDDGYQPQHQHECNAQEPSMRLKPRIVDAFEGQKQTTYSQ